MPLFQVQLVVEGDLRLSEEFTLDGYQFSPTPEGFSLIFQIEAVSSEVAKKDAAAKVQLLMDSITFAKGTSLRHRFSQITEMPSREGGSQVLSTEVYLGADAYLVFKEGREGIAPAFDLAKRIPGHKKADVLARVLRWHARGTSDSDSVDKFVDYWVALETLANSYEAEVVPEVCRCGRTVRKRPVNGILRAYLESLGMVEAADRISTLGQARGKLFHVASTEALEYLSEVQGILKTCIQKELA